MTMKITKELLEYLNISTMTISGSASEDLCVLSKVTGKDWFLNITYPMKYFSEENISLKINFANETEKKTSIIKSGRIIAPIKELGDNWISIDIEKCRADKEASNVIDTLNKLVFNDEKYGRRKENRYEIGTKNFKNFSMNSAEQMIYLKTAKITLPCAIKDISLHGMCIICPDSIALDRESTIIVRICFNEPEQSTLLTGHKVFIKKISTKSKKYAVISLQLLEPVHFVFRQRLIEYIQKTDHSTT